MKRNIVGALAFILLTMLSCQLVEPAPTATPTPKATITPLPTNTPTAEPTPTATQEPTPAPIGLAVLYNDLEITVIDAVTHGLIYPGGYSAWYPNNPDRDIFLDVGVLVRNTGDPVWMDWNVIGIVEESGDAWYPVFAASQLAENGKKIDPFYIGIPESQLNGTAQVLLKDDTYLRLIFIVNKKPGKTILFNLEYSPYIAFEMK